MIVLSCVAVGLLGLTACKEDALEREFINQKGVYEGQPDTPLTDEQERTLSQRALMQSN